MHNEFSEKYVPTEQKETYYPSVIINDHLYELKISDIPVISYFPLNSYYEWADFRFYGLRSATAYILVFDLSNVDTFQYIRTMREQMMESRDMKRVPVIVVGSKQDLIATDANANAGAPAPAGNNALSGSSLDQNQRKRRDIVNLVKKHWKCNYVECSAKYNWGIIAVFKELMEVIDSMDPNKNSKEVYSSPMIDNIHDAFDGNKCVIL